MDQQGQSSSEIDSVQQIPNPTGAEQVSNAIYNERTDFNSNMNQNLPNIGDLNQHFVNLNLSEQRGFNEAQHFNSKDEVTSDSVVEQLENPSGGTQHMPGPLDIKEVLSLPGPSSHMTELQQADRCLDQAAAAFYEHLKHIHSLFVSRTSPTYLDWTEDQRWKHFLCAIDTVYHMTKDVLSRTISMESDSLTNDPSSISEQFTYISGMTSQCHEESRTAQKLFSIFNESRTREEALDGNLNLAMTLGFDMLTETLKSTKVVVWRLEAAQKRWTEHPSLMGLLLVNDDP